jgi:hypothetical protein
LFSSSIVVPSTGMAAFDGQLKGTGATLQRGKLDLAREVKSWEPKLDEGGGSGGTGNKIFNGGQYQHADSLDLAVAGHRASSTSHGGAACTPFGCSSWHESQPTSRCTNSGVAQVRCLPSKVCDMVSEELRPEFRFQ